MKPSLPLSKGVAYAIGQLGWSLVLGLVVNYLIYFYLPPAEARLPELIPSFYLFGFLSIIGLITMGGRFIDAITDPWIATLSDRSTARRGRRISFMAKGGLPMVVMMVLLFTPPSSVPGALNVIWLTVTLFLFYLFYTIYVTPYFALIAELGHTPQERLNLSTYISLTFFLGTALASQAPMLFPLFEATGMDRVASIRVTFALLGLLSLICLYVPVFAIDEKKYSTGVPSTVPMFDSLRLTFSNPNFLPFALSDMVYFLALTILQTGLIYYVTVLLRQQEQFYSLLFIVMAVVSFACYPAVNLLARRTGKKKMIVGSFIIFALTFAMTSLFGLPFIPLSLTAQGYLLAILGGLPLAAFGILPNAIVADIAEHDALKTGSHREGIYYGARTFMQKIGQMIAMLVFTSLLVLGRDVGNDLGLRLSGLVAGVLCLGGLYLFNRYDEKQVLLETEQMKVEQEGAK
ncbi:MAG: MFS transporter [Dethiobacteria bacterium]|nr:MFS transporter [Dethiobacteria bacterium]